MESSIRISKGNIIFDQLRYTDEPVHLVYVYERTKTNPVGLDRFNVCVEEILSPIERDDDEKYSFILIGTVNQRYTKSIDNHELGKFVSLSELNKIYMNVREISSPIDA
ncbi:MAG: hypothetical protein K0B07_03285 [DPANN group archaeon]|nr:hypothetical protein [DPANN group archaeon]